MVFKNDMILLVVGIEVPQRTAREKPTRRLPHNTRRSLNQAPELRVRTTWTGWLHSQPQWPETRHKLVFDGFRGLMDPKSHKCMIQSVTVANHRVTIL